MKSDNLRTLAAGQRSEMEMTQELTRSILLMADGHYKKGKEKMITREEALRKIRERMDKEKGGSGRDPNEWRAPKVKPGEEQSVQFYVLPPVIEGDTVVGGKATRGMTEMFWHTVGTHWINARPQECPRLHDKEKCPLCDLGFELLRDEENPETRREIAKKYMPTVKYVVNAYFPALDGNPEDLRDTVKWVALPKTVIDVMDETIRRDGPGKDKYDPQPYGLFFSTGIEDWCDADYSGGFLFKMVMRSIGGYNDYKSSKFIYQSLGPIARDKNGKADAKKIQKILDGRHDIFSKFSIRDKGALQTIVDELLHNTSGAPSSGFDHDEVILKKEEAPSRKTTKSSGLKDSKTTTIVEVEDEELQALMAKIQSGA